MFLMDTGMTENIDPAVQNKGFYYLQTKDSSYRHYFRFQWAQVNPPSPFWCCKVEDLFTGPIHWICRMVLFMSLLPHIDAFQG